MPSQAGDAQVVTHYNLENLGFRKHKTRTYLCSFPAIFAWCWAAALRLCKEWHSSVLASSRTGQKNGAQRRRNFSPSCRLPWLLTHLRHGAPNRLLPWCGSQPAAIRLLAEVWTCADAVCFGRSKAWYSISKPSKFRSLHSAVANFPEEHFITELLRPGGTARHCSLS